MASLASRTTTARRRRASLCRSDSRMRLTSSMSMKVTTAPSITFSRVRYGRMRSEYQVPARVCTSTSRGTRVSSTALQVLDQLVVAHQVGDDVAHRPTDVGRDQVDDLE